VLECQKIKKRGLDQYGTERFARLIFVTIRKSMRLKRLKNKVNHEADVCKWALSCVCLDTREGYCYYTLANDGRCLQHSDRVPAITKPACCCTGGAAWGPKCEKCPAVGTGILHCCSCVNWSASHCICSCAYFAHCVWTNTSRGHLIIIIIIIIIHTFLSRHKVVTSEAV